MTEQAAPAQVASASPEVVISGTTVDPNIAQATAARAAQRKAAAIAAYSAQPEPPNEAAPEAAQVAAAEGNAEAAKIAEKEESEQVETPAEKPGDRVRKYLAARQEKAEAAKLKAEIAQMREQQERALEQARADARRDAYERIRKHPKTALEEAGLDPSGLVQSAMDEITTDPVRKLELQLEQQKSEFARARKELQDLREGLAQERLQAQAENGQRMVLGIARKAEDYPLLNARHEQDGSLLHEYFTLAKEYHARTGEMPAPDDMLAYMEDRERAVYAKVYGEPAKPKPAIKGRTRGISPAAAMQREGADAPGDTAEARRLRAKEAYIRAVR